MDNYAVTPRTIIRRTHIRNAGLMFLLIVILLTFFSKTINSFLMSEVECKNPVSGFLQTEISAKGTVKALNVEKIYVYGNWTVTDVKVGEGAEVAKGDVLATVGTEDVRLDMKAGELEVIRMENALEQYRESFDAGKHQDVIILLSKAVDKAQKELDSAKSLYESGAETQKAVEDAQDRLDSAIRDYRTGLKEFDLTKMDYERTLKEKETELELKKLEYERLTSKMPKDGNIIADADGIVRMAAIEKGSACNNGQVIFELIKKDSPMMVEWSLNPEKADKIKVGDDVAFKINSNGSSSMVSSSIEGTIKEKQYLPASGMYILSSVIRRDMKGIKDGQEVTATVKKISRDYQFIVPNSSITKGNGNDYMFVIKQYSRVLGNVECAVMVKVKVEESDDFNSAVTGPINPDNNIVIFSSKALTDGVQVKLK